MLANQPYLMPSRKRKLPQKIILSAQYPNVGVVPVPDERLDHLAEIVKPERILPTTRIC